MAGATMRRSDRVCMTLLLEVDGTDSFGHSFKTAGRTMLISRHGAVIVLDQTLEPHAELTIRRRAPGETYRQGLVKVIGLFGHEHDQRVVPHRDYIKLFAGAVNPHRAEPNWRPGYNIIEISIETIGPKRKLLVHVHAREWQQSPGR